MTTTEAAGTIFKAMGQLRSGEITDAEFRETMGAIRSELGETAFMLAKFSAAAADSR